MTKTKWAITSRSKLITIILLVLLSSVFPLFSSKYIIHILVICWLLAISSIGWNICYGYTGLLSFGHTVFFGISAYITLWLLVPFQITPWIGIFIGASIACVLGLLITFVTIRTRGIYFALATFALPQILIIIFNTFWQVTGGAYGVIIPFAEENAYLMYFYDPVFYYYIALAFLISVLVLQLRLSESKLGYCLRAIGSDEDAANSLGIDPFRTRLFGMGISSFVTGLSGGIFVNFLKFIDPVQAFGWPLNIQMILGTVVGGVGTIFGPVIGVLVVVPLTEIMKLWIEQHFRGLNLVINGVILMLFIVLMPRGVYPWLKKLFEKYLGG
ncbi:branched-chain amino acid ABC transporter permease [Candidatus Bathyarchaeota archaeon]|nr:MAG: branched-chain amino acid ABC transporter permease [Candidatus Bathyarchaeota archaeon]